MTNKAKSKPNYPNRLQPAISRTRNQSWISSKRDKWWKRQRSHRLSTSQRNTICSLRRKRTRKRRGKCKYPQLRLSGLMRLRYLRIKMANRSARPRVIHKTFHPRWLTASKNNLLKTLKVPQTLMISYSKSRRNHALRVLSRRSRKRIVQTTEKTYKLLTFKGDKRLSNQTSALKTLCHLIQKSQFHALRYPNSKNPKGMKLFTNRWKSTLN